MRYSRLPYPHKLEKVVWAIGSFAFFTIGVVLAEVGLYWGAVLPCMAGVYCWVASIRCTEAEAQF